MNKETLEEANWKVLGTKTDTFYEGAKWQQETILQLLKDNGYEDDPVFEFFEDQFKKK